MYPRDFGLFAIAIAINSIGQFLLKAGANELAQAAPNSLANAIGKIATTPTLVAGLMFYGCGSIAYILLLSRVDLSVAGPATALAYVTSVAIGYFVFRETISATQAIGLAAIVFGVVLVVSQR